MNRPLEVRPNAEADLQEIHEYLLGQNENAADKLTVRVKALFERIESMPFMYAKVWRTVRAVKARGCKHVVYYIVRPKLVEVIAVVHGSRHSSAWKSRV